MLYGKEYVLRKTDRVLLYGAATTGAIVYGNLIKSGFRVDGFIDQRADEISGYYGLPVWEAAEAGRREGADAAVVVAIKNVFEHERVAAKLWRAGFRRIIFRPYRSLRGEETERDRLLNSAYDRMMDKGGVGELGPCPEIEGPEGKPLKDQAVILDEGDYVTANIPAPLVFTDRYEDQSIIWGDIPSLGLLPHRGLFDVFNGKWNPDYEEYMKYCRRAAERSGGIVTSKAWEASVYQNRLDVFSHMQYSWEHDRDFFVRNATEGVYNPKGYFNIRSGKHRVAYLLTKGGRYIPLRIKKADYEIWREKERADRIGDFLWKNDLETLPVLLMNPYFYDYVDSASAFYEKALDSLVTALCRDKLHAERPIRFAGEKILFFNTPMALYARLFRALGFEVFIYEQDRIKRGLDEIVLSGTAIRFLEEAELEAGAYDAAVLEGTGQSVRVRVAAVICGEARKDKEAAACGLSGGELLYAYLFRGGADV